MISLGSLNIQIEMQHRINKTKLYFVFRIPEPYPSGLLTVSFILLAQSFVNFDSYISIVLRALYLLEPASVFVQQSQFQ